MSGRPVTKFLVECYLPGIERAAIIDAGGRIRHAVDELRRQGEEVEYLGATFVPDDEVVFHAFVASRAAVVDVASRAAGLSFERIVESIDVAPQAMARARGAEEP